MEKRIVGCAARTNNNKSCAQRTLRLILKLSLYLFALALAACSHVPPRQSSCILLPEKIAFCLQPSHKELYALQTTEISVAGKSEKLITSLEVDTEGWRLTGLTPFGQRLFHASYKENQIKVDTLQQWGKRIDPALVLVLAQLTFLPLEQVRLAVIEEPRVRIEEMQKPTHQRSLFLDDREIIRIDYEGKLPPYRRFILSYLTAGLKMTVTAIDNPK